MRFPSSVGAPWGCVGDNRDLRGRDGCVVLLGGGCFFALSLQNGPRVSNPGRNNKCPQRDKTESTAPEVERLRLTTSKGRSEFRVSEGDGSGVPLHRGNDIVDVAMKMNRYINSCRTNDRVFCEPFACVSRVKRGVWSDGGIVDQEEIRKARASLKPASC